MSNNLLKISLFSFAILMLSSSASMAVTLPSQARAEVVSPLTISEVTDLNFGIFDNFAAGNVTIGTDDSLTTVLTHLGGGSRAAFTITGREDEVYNITIPASVTLNGSGSASGSSMSATLIGVSANSGLAALGTLTGGSDTVYVGGTLVVASNQTAGSYSGTYNVTVQY